MRLNKKEKQSQRRKQAFYLLVLAVIFGLFIYAYNYANTDDTTIITKTISAK